MDALAADFCPPKKTIVETIAAAPSRHARFCFSFSLSSEDDSDEDATIEKHASFALFLFDDDDDALLLMMKILLLPVGFCSRLEDDDRIIHLSFFEEEESLKEEEEEPTKADTKAALLLIEDIIEFAFFARSDGIHERDTTTTLKQLSDPFLCSLSGFLFSNGVVLLNPNSHKTLNKKNSSYCVYSYTYRGTKNRERSERARDITRSRFVVLILLLLQNKRF
jgi:hypothetical protein